MIGQIVEVVKVVEIVEAVEIVKTVEVVGGWRSGPAGLSKGDLRFALINCG